MKGRKGWHRKKRRLRHDYKAQFKNTLLNHYRETLPETWKDSGFCALMEEALNRTQEDISK